MYCQTCDGDSHLCSDLHLHYAYFSQENLPKVVGGINPHRVNKEQNLQTLPLETYIKLVNNSRSISKVVRSLAKYNFMMDTLEAMPIKPNTTTTMMAKSIVMLQPNMLTKLRKFVPTDDDLQQAFYQLVKSS